MIKIKNKILVLIPMLFLLSGCTYEHSAGGIMHIGEWMEERLTKAGLSIVQFVNTLNASIVSLMLDFSGDALGETARDTLKGFGSITGIINLISILAVALIIVNFAKSVFKNNFTTVDRATAPSAIQLFKKIFVAVVATLVIPYLCIGSFVVSTYAGQKIGTVISSDGTPENGNIWKIYNEMDADGVTYSTYCEEGQKAAGVKKISDLKNKCEKNEPCEVILSEDPLYEKYCNYGPGASGIPHEDYKNYTPKNVFESLKYSRLYSPTVLLFGYSLDIGTGGQAAQTITDVGVPAGGAVALHFLKLLSPKVIGFIALICVAFIGVILLFSVIATVKRTIDLLMLITMSWWYIGSSISDQEGQTAINDLLKKLLKICMSQFFLNFELVIFIQTCLSKGISASQIFMVIAWSLVLISTPSVVEEMVGSTNTVEGAKASGKAMFNFFTGGK